MDTTFPRLLAHHARHRPGDAALREKEYGIWQTITWADMAKMVEHMACGLHQAGLTRGEHVVVVGVFGAGGGRREWWWWWTAVVERGCG
jgi:long-chain acyl-CoA synthetase